MDSGGRRWRTLKRIPIYLLLLSSLSLVPFSGFHASQPFQHERIVVRGMDGSPLTLDSKAPYSPKKTCGACHDYDQITKGYHFQQGRTDASGKIAVRDTFDSKSPWNLSSGMYGKFSFVSADASQLAKKENRSASEIDKSSFFFVQFCGPCHPGGGFGEYDRSGVPYYNDESRKFGYEVTGENFLLDGDYTPFSRGEIGYGAPWDKSGVSEADCLICHLKGYLWKERGAALRGRFFREGPSAGAGWGKIRISQDEPESPKAEDVTIDYSQKEPADFQNLHLQLVRTPPDENCWSCHAASDGRKTGWQWSSDTDIHKARELTCVTCHASRQDHNFAKGESLQVTVRDDLDNSMHSCEDCHYKGKNRKAPRYKHPFSPRHMRRIACQTCHIPYLTASADLVFDHASSGKTTLYETSKFLSNQPFDPKGSNPGLDPGLWYPAIREVKGKIVPVKPLVVIYWGDFDEQLNDVQPIPLWKIRDLPPPSLKDDNLDGVPEINSLEEIKSFLSLLKRKDRFGNPIARQPTLVKGGFLFRFDKKGNVEKVKRDAPPTLDYSLNHNVVSGSNVIGARGCRDCHTKKSPFFLKKVLVDPFDEKGKPVYTEAWETLGLDKEKLNRLLLEQ